MLYSYPPLLKFQFTPLREGRRYERPAITDWEAFQFTPLREGRPPLAECADSVTYFNSRPSARGDHRRKWRDSNAAGISIHAPPRGATCTAALRWLRSTIPIHAPPRGATPPVPRHRRPPHHFNSRPSARGDRMSSAASLAWCYFNSRPSARGDCLCCTHIRHCSNFNSRPSARGDAMSALPLQIGKHFNSRPSARGDPWGSVAHAPCASISIHAPPRGATRCRRERGFRQRGFQFTPLREGRPASTSSRYFALTFQFTPLREGRLNGFIGNLRFDIFQFTPLREGRLDGCPGPPVRLHFNSRPSARGDRALSPCLSSWIFQFTPLREGRRRVTATRTAKSANFNSRPSARGDGLYPKASRSQINFNSRPSARGDHHPRRGRLLRMGISIHAPPRGATVRMLTLLAVTTFQFTPLREGRRQKRIDVGITSAFQFTPLREGRLFAVWMPENDFDFNSRPSARGDNP